MSIRNSSIALALCSAVAIAAAIPASAGPLPIGNSSLQTATKSGDTTEIRWRGRGIGPGLAFGLAAGALTGAAVAARPYGYYGGYGPGYYAEEPVYAEPYSYGPSYPAYGNTGYGYGGCYTDEGYGRVQSCDR